MPESKGILCSFRWNRKDTQNKSIRGDFHLRTRKNDKICQKFNFLRFWPFFAHIWTSSHWKSTKLVSVILDSVLDWLDLERKWFEGLPLGHLLSSKSGLRSKPDCCWWHAQRPPRPAWNGRSRRDLKRKRRLSAFEWAINQPLIPSSSRDISV